MTLSLHTYAQGPGVVIRLQGDATSEHATREVTDEVTNIAGKRPGFILLNCHGINDIDANGMQDILSSAHRALKLNSNVVIVSPRQPLLDRLERFAEQTGAEDIIPVFRTQGQAQEVLAELPTELPANMLHELLTSYGKSSFDPEPYSGGTTGP